MPTNVCLYRTELRLFVLRYGKYGAAVRNSRGNILYFTDKESAKRSRDELNSGLTEPIFVVSNGPDHKPVVRKTRLNKFKRN